jgi:hypothetical protein
MPLSRGFRIFVLDGEPLYTVQYWEQGAYHPSRPPDAMFGVTLRQIRSRFYTMDVARRIDGSWMILELGDAQVAGLPDAMDLRSFYAALIERVRSAEVRS